MAKPTVTAGFMCAPEMWPTVYTMTMTAIPHTTVIPGNVTTPCFSPFTTMAAMPANSKKNVENNSARSYTDQHNQTRVGWNHKMDTYTCIYIQAILGISRDTYKLSSLTI